MGKGTIRILLALVLLVFLAAAMIMALLLRRHGLKPETAAVGIASATIIGALITQVVNAYIARSNQKHTQELADQRAQAEALKNYLERMSELVTKDNLRAEHDPYSEKRILARVQTKTVLLGLDPVRKRHLLLFLREMRLINRFKNEPGAAKTFPQIVGLNGADLEKADLRGARLISTSRKEPVSLEGAILKNADLAGADLECASLARADLQGADMTDVFLKKAVLSGANFQGTTFDGASLEEADLTAYVPEEGDQTPIPSDLRKAKGLTEGQIERAIGDETTRLPDNLQPPESWRKRVESPG
jgi:hypothetical protein